MVTVYDEDFARVARSPELTSPEWTCDRPLARGKTYTWQVSALTAAGERHVTRLVTVPPRPRRPRGSSCLTPAAGSTSSHARVSRTPSAHLVMALAYARAGVRDAAERELRALQRDNPDAAIVRTLLASLR